MRNRNFCFPRIRYAILWSDPLEFFSGAWLRVVTAISCCQLIRCNPVAADYEADYAERAAGSSACAYLAFSVSPRHLHNIIIVRPPSRAINRSIGAHNSSFFWHRAVSLGSLSREQHRYVVQSASIKSSIVSTSKIYFPMLSRIITNDIKIRISDIITSVRNFSYR